MRRNYGGWAAFLSRRGFGLSATVRFNCVCQVAQVRESRRKVTESGYPTDAAKRAEKLRNLQAHTGIVCADRMRRHEAVHRAGRAERGRARGTKAAVFRQCGSGGCDAETGFDMSPTGIVSGRAADGQPVSQPAAADARRECPSSRPVLNPAACPRPPSRADRAERGRVPASKSAELRIQEGLRKTAAQQETGPKSSETRRRRIQPPSICTMAPILKPTAPNWAIKNPTIYETIFATIFAPEF